MVPRKDLNGPLTKASCAKAIHGEGEDVEVKRERECMCVREGGKERERGREREGERETVLFSVLMTFLGMNAQTCVPYSDMTSMDSYYSSTAAQGLQTDHFRTFSTSPETKYSSITAFLPSKGQAYGEKSRSPFQQECQSLDAATAGPGTFGKYHLFMQRSSCKTPPEDEELHRDRGHNGASISCYGEWT